MVIRNRLQTVLDYFPFTTKNVSIFGRMVCKCGTTFRFQDMKFDFTNPEFPRIVIKAQCNNIRCRNTRGEYVDMTFSFTGFSRDGVEPTHIQKQGMVKIASNIINKYHGKNGKEKELQSELGIEIDEDIIKFAEKEDIAKIEDPKERVNKYLKIGDYQSIHKDIREFIEQYKDKSKEAQPTKKEIVQKVLETFDSESDKYNIERLAAYISNRHPKTISSRNLFPFKVPSKRVMLITNLAEFFWNYFRENESKSKDKSK